MTKYVDAFQEKVEGLVKKQVEESVEFLNQLIEEKIEAGKYSMERITIRGDDITELGCTLQMFKTRLEKAGFSVSDVQGQANNAYFYLNFKNELDFSK